MTGCEVARIVFIILCSICGVGTIVALIRKSPFIIIPFLGTLLFAGLIFCSTVHINKAAKAKAAQIEISE